MNLFAAAALWGFWILLVAGAISGELRPTGTAVFVVLWMAGFAGSGRILGGTLFTPYVAVLDIVLVLIIFKGDIRLH